MGNKIKGNYNFNGIKLSNSKESNIKKQILLQYGLQELSTSLFDISQIIGVGGFGKVYKVTKKKSKKVYALKQIPKQKIIEKKAETIIKNERDLLILFDHPFVVKIYYSFQDRDNLYLVFDFLPGGDLRYHLTKERKFTEEQSKFYISCVLLGIEYLHTNSVIHRDLKPENLVLDEKGYSLLTDFGIAKLYQKECPQEISGTPGYMSPEAIFGLKNTPAADFFSLGILTYEFMTGRRPYIAKSRSELREKSLKSLHVNVDEVPEGWDLEVVDFINKLLIKSPANRIGLRSCKEVREHPWLRGIKWKDLYEKKIPAPFVPKKGEFIHRNVENKKEANKESENYNSIEFQKMFDNFDFYRISEGEIFKNKIGINFIDKVFVNPHLNITNDNGNQQPTIVTNKKKFHFASSQAFSSSNTVLRREYKIINEYNEKINNEVGNVIKE